MNLKHLIRLIRNPTRSSRLRAGSRLHAAAEACEERQLLSVANGTDARIDGTANNLTHLGWGATDTELLRLADSEYADGISEPAGEDRVSARIISNEIFDQSSEVANARNLTDFIWMWGQFLDHDIDLSESSEHPEAFNIQVPAGDEHFDPFGTGEVEIPLNRTVYVEGRDSSDGIRQQINQITAWIDGSVVYGSDNVRAGDLRTFEGGLLRTSEGDLLPFNTGELPNAGGTADDLFIAGDVRANENVALLSMHTLFVREHNRIAGELASEDPNLSDEELYQQARARVRSLIQNITYNEFLPALLGPDALPEYSGYDDSIDPTIANEFSTAAYRLGHSLLSPTLQRLDADGNEIAAGHLPLQNAFFNPTEYSANGIDSLLRGASAQAAQELDAQIIDDVRNFLFGPPGAGGLDLASLNIQRGRDHGLADYNSVRASLGLTPVTSFDQITGDADLAARLATVYDSVDDIDLWVGGLAEDHLEDSSLGETFTAILVDQFTRLRDGDRYWFENIYSGAELEEIRSTRLSDIIERNTDITGLQSNVFFLRGTEVVNVDLTDSNAGDTTVERVGDEVRVVRTTDREILFRRSLDDIGGLRIRSESPSGGLMRIDGHLRGEDLPMGITAVGSDSPDDVLVVNGSRYDDRMSVFDDRVTVNSLDVLFSQFETVDLHGMDGNDVLDASARTSGGLIMSGDAGNDTLIGSSADDRMFGNEGNDLLRGGGGDDMMFGGSGEDRMYGEHGRDRMLGNDQRDFLQHDGSTARGQDGERLAAHLSAMLGFRNTGNFYENWGGRGEKWIRGNGAWYFITPEGNLYRWNGQPGADGTLIDSLPSDYHASPRLLITAGLGAVDDDRPEAAEQVVRDLNRDVTIRVSGNQFFNWGGRNEKWFWTSDGWCFITPDGMVMHWDGTNRLASGQAIAQLPTDYYTDPARLMRK